MSGSAVRAWAWGGFLFVFLLLFSLCQMGGLERREQEEGAISATVQAKHQPQPWIERLGHYGTLGRFGGGEGGGFHCVREDAVLILLMPGNFARLVKKLVLGDVSWKSVGANGVGGGGGFVWRRPFVIEHHQSVLVPAVKKKMEFLNCIQHKMNERWCRVVLSSCISKIR